MQKFESSGEICITIYRRLEHRWFQELFFYASDLFLNLSYDEINAQIHKRNKWIKIFTK